jgi:mono/diheme cytochrome c family protein
MTIVRSVVKTFGLMSLSVLVIPALLATTPANADEGTIAYGGKLYDKWFKVTGAPKPADTHMSWPKSNTKKKGNATHRCKSCHGWDNLGKDGAYASGSYKTGITGLKKFVGGNAADVVAIMNDKTHGYTGKMADADMNALAMFVTLGQVDMDKYIDRKSKKAKGNATQGKEYFTTLCINCHGADGKLPKDMPALGMLSNKNPWEVMHKILNGQPGEGMPGLRALPVSVTADVNAYLQTLPKK